MNQDQMPTSELPSLGTNNESIQSPVDSISMEYPVDKSVSSKRKKFVTLLAVIFVFAVVLAGGYLLLNRNSGRTILSPFPNKDKVNVGGMSKKVISPLTGVLFSENDAESWMNERPLGFMINNHTDARPQSNLSKADLVYEVVAEGGITRFLAFYLTETPEKIGPIRSAREYYLVLVKELSDAMIMHWGYSPQALEAIETWPVRSLFVGGAGSETYCPDCTWRDNPRNVATEHTLYGNGQKLRQRAVELGWEGRGDISVWSFKDDFSGYSDSQVANDIKIDFWFEGDYSGIFKYNPEKNEYLRFTGYDQDGNPIPHVDEEGPQVSPKNVIVQFAVESGVEGDDKNRLEYELVGSGEALVFIDGKVVSATWVKEERDSRTMYYDTNGEEMMFNRGKFWIAIVPDRNMDQVLYQ